MTMAITRGIKDKLDKYGSNLPVDKRTRAYKKILSDDKWTDSQHQSYLKQVLKRYTNKRKKLYTQTNRCIFDYIINKYGKVKGFIRVCQDYETLNEFFQEQFTTDIDYFTEGSFYR